MIKMKIIARSNNQREWGPDIYCIVDVTEKLINEVHTAYKIIAENSFINSISINTDRYKSLFYEGTDELDEEELEPDYFEEYTGNLKLASYDSEEIRVQIGCVTFLMWGNDGSECWNQIDISELKKFYKK